MPHETVPNFALADIGDTSSAVWKLTRGLKKAGWAHLASSDGTGVETTNDKWGNNANPLLDSYPALGAGAWILLQGPSTLKIPIGSGVPTGNFLRGEKVVQAGNHAEGEILGIVTATDGQGYLVVSPRTGTFNGMNPISGAFSGATIVLPGLPVISFDRQVVFWRSNVTTGHAYYQCVDNVGEAEHQFSHVARLAAVTPTVCPGGATSGPNEFPSVGTMVMLGTGGSGTVTTGSKPWILSSISPAEIGNVQILVANASPSVNTSPDGSFTIAFGTPVLEPGSFIGFGLMRLDDHEDGDVDPYAVFAPNGNMVYSGSRTTATNVITTENGSDVARQFFTANACVCNTLAGSREESAQPLTAWRGFRRRGLSGEGFQEFVGHFLSSFNGTDTSPAEFNDAPIFANSTNNDSVATAFSVCRVREPIWIISTQAKRKMRKGTLRWWYLVQGGAGCDTFDNKQWIQLGSARNLPNTFFRGPVVAGPWDGKTPPTNA